VAMVLHQGPFHYKRVTTETISQREQIKNTARKQRELSQILT
jgi:hypothetical protein